MANDTGLTAAFIQECHAANDGRYSRMSRCRAYLQNAHNGSNPHAAMTLEEVLATSDQESINLWSSYSIVQHELLTIGQARTLSEAERTVLIEGAVAAGVESGTLEHGQLCVAALLAYRANNVPHPHPHPHPHP
ncbi:hypothetical protein BH10PSE19_BH10PSE19_19530 [soil metagenome]